MSRALSNAFTSNYAKDVNSSIHLNKKKTNSGNRSQESDKLFKLSGSKKEDRICFLFHIFKWILENEFRYEFSYLVYFKDPKQTQPN